MTDVPKRRGRPPRVMAQPTDRLATLTAREKALSIKAAARHRYTLDLPLDLYEALLDQAESYGIPLPDVCRATMRSGLAHIKQFGGPAAHNPYVMGALNPLAQHDIQPYGTEWPPINHQLPLNPAWDSPPALNIRQDTPPKMVMIPPGLLPNGFTNTIEEQGQHPPRIPAQAMEPDDGGV